MNGTRDLCDVGAVAIFGLKRVDVTRDDVSDKFWRQLVVLVDISEPEPVLLLIDAGDDTLAADLFCRVEAFLDTDSTISELDMVARNNVPEWDTILWLNKFGLVGSMGGRLDGKLGALFGWVEMLQGA